MQFQTDLAKLNCAETLDRHWTACHFAWLHQVPVHGQAGGFPAQLASQLERRAKAQPHSWLPSLFVGFPAYLLASQPICWLPSLFVGFPAYLLASQPICWLPSLFVGFPAHDHKNNCVAPPSRNLSVESALQNIYYRRVCSHRCPSRRFSPWPCCHTPPKKEKRGGRCVGPKARLHAPHLANSVIQPTPCGRIWVGLSYVQLDNWQASQLPS